MKRKNVGDGTPPAICTPLVGNCKDQIIAELADILSKKPDMLEWRADFFQDIGNTAEILAVADLITSTARNVPIIFTVRSNREGGEPI
ncbi:MAG: 3-dehydroquinate dehydratase [Anaerospora sp.]|nr:3-dehydroquinate dehydratase [Anaerospora sp.]